MSSLQKYKQLILDGELLSDEEVEEILRVSRGLVDLAFEQMLEEGGGAKSE